MRAAPPKLLLIILVVLVVGILEGIKPVKGVCLCAERFASSIDFINDTTAPFFDNFQDGQTIVFRSAAFHCNTVLTTVSFSGQTKNCGDIHCNNSNNNNNNDGLQQPMLQLWRQNSTTEYIMAESLMLTAENIHQTIPVQWSVERNDVLGIWIPSSCHCTTNLLKIGYLYGHGGSRVYRIDGDIIDGFDTIDYTLQHGPMPMISVQTEDDYNGMCIIGLPAGALVALIALCFTCCSVCWSISVYNSKIHKTKGTFDISVPLDDQTQNETEMNQVPQNVNMYDEDVRYNSLGRPIYTMPLPPLPTNIDDEEPEVETRSLNSDPQLSYTRQTSNISHSMSNPDLSNSTHSYGNVSHTRSLTRNMQQETQPLPKAPIAQPRSNMDSTRRSITQYPTAMPPQPTSDPLYTNSVPSSPGLNSATESNRDMTNMAEQSYDRDSEYELPDDECDEVGGEVQDEYMDIQGLKIDRIESSGSDDVYY